MTDFRQVTNTVSVSPQITTADIDAAKEQGFTLLINNRPDGEELGQPTNADLEAYANEAGIKWLHIPFAGTDLTLNKVMQMNYELKRNEKILAFCRTGTRSCNIWALASALTNELANEEIIANGSTAGYDLSGMEASLDHIRELNTSA
ncbi:TIGR01244 family phosphatase [Kordiimonas sp. SCSIO 12603]|uniref:TIGR01244 family sulfur transferase n=1 Tax=Kordiimonas sp. SCSIO 12603 TaxID=2829596 RepID=UPI00210598CC|nr:TIGR01244 family sulfur transferase [Kordiimonas sp. SCSIO 12603]UTW59357.1 TIGR01244 family phosphatase [Kordiimonas sp. SCSIO 12603]